MICSFKDEERSPIATTNIKYPVGAHCVRPNPIMGTPTLPLPGKHYRYPIYHQIGKIFADKWIEISNHPHGMVNIQDADNTNHICDIAIRNHL